VFLNLSVSHLHPTWAVPLLMPTKQSTFYTLYIQLTKLLYQAMKFLTLSSSLYLASILVSSNVADSTFLRGILDEGCFYSCAIEPCQDTCNEDGHGFPRPGCVDSCIENQSEYCKSICMVNAAESSLLTVG
jgi:hypothetical protein